MTEEIAIGANRPAAGNTKRLTYALGAQKGGHDDEETNQMVASLRK